MSIELKIKEKSLAEEAKIIKLEEAKLKNEARVLRIKEHFVSNDEPFKQTLEARRRKAEAGFDNIYRHRIGVVRPECRATHLARAYIKGLPARQVERHAYELPLMNRILAMVNKYHSKEITLKDIKNWYYLTT